MYEAIFNMVKFNAMTLRMTNDVDERLDALCNLEYVIGHAKGVPLARKMAQKAIRDYVINLFKDRKNDDFNQNKANTKVSENKEAKNDN